MWRLQGKDRSLILVKRLRFTARVRDISGHAVAIPALAQKLVQQLFDNTSSLDPFWVVFDATAETFTFIDEIPDDLEERSEVGDLGDAFGFRLFFEAGSKNDSGFLADCVLDQAKPPVEKVVP